MKNTWPCGCFITGKQKGFWNWRAHETFLEYYNFHEKWSWNNYLTLVYCYWLVPRFVSGHTDESYNHGVFYACVANVRCECYREERVNARGSIYTHTRTTSENVAMGLNLTLIYAHIWEDSSSESCVFSYECCGRTWYIWQTFETFLLFSSFEVSEYIFKWP